jgi:uncharacterized protein DUF6289
MSLSYRKLLLLIGAVALLATSLILGAPRTAEALPAASCDCTYYSDATYTTEVGSVFITCRGQRFQSGQTSPYKICACEDC